MILRTFIAVCTIFSATLLWPNTLPAAGTLDLVITGNTLGHVRPCED